MSDPFQLPTLPSIVDADRQDAIVECLRTMLDLAEAGSLSHLLLTAGMTGSVDHRAYVCCFGGTVDDLQSELDGFLAECVADAMGMNDDDAAGLN